MIKAYFLSFYSEKGYAEGHIVGVIVLAGSLALIGAGVFAISELWFELNLFSFLDNSEYGARSLGKLIAFIFIILSSIVLFILSFFSYKKWVAEYEQMNSNQAYSLVDRGESLKNKFILYSLAFCALSFILAAIFGG